MRTNWLLIGLLYGVGLLAAAQFAKIALTLESLEVVFPNAPVPFMVSALSVMGIIFGVTAGIVVARLGPRRVILVGLVAAALASALQASLPPFPVFLGLRLAEGATHLALVIAAPTLMASVTAPKDTPLAMGLWGTFFGVGFALSALAVRLLDTPPALYLAHAACLLILAIALWPLTPRSTTQAEGGEGFIARHLAIYRRLTLVAPGAIFFWHTAMFLGILTFLPRYLGEWTAPLLPLAALVGTMGAGILARHQSPILIAAVGYALSAVGMAAIALSPDGARALLAFPVLAVAGIAAGASFATVPQLNPDTADRARANGALAQLGNVGTATSTPLFAATLPFGIAGPLGLAIAISVVGLFVTILLQKNLAPDARNAAT
ncbi:MAG: MFS transporter [Pseudomonadota bacterium]